MKRIIIICEGPTEAEFCGDVLVPYFAIKEIYIQTPLINKAGGIVHWQRLKNQIETHLKQDPTAFVTTLIDFYGIHDWHEFPEWQPSKALQKQHRLDVIEMGMKNDIYENAQHRFIPYIQLHEFEGLLFNNITVFENQIPPEDFINKEELVNTINNYPNPELINDSPENAPSYRLKRLIKGYNKIVYGSILAQDIGLERIRMKSPRFNKWIHILQNC